MLFDSRFLIKVYLIITEIRIMEWKTDKGWSYKWWNCYMTVGYKIVTEKKTGIIKIRNSTTMVLVLQ